MPGISGVIVMLLNLVIGELGVDIAEEVAVEMFKRILNMSCVMLLCVGIIDLRFRMNLESV